MILIQRTHTIICGNKNYTRKSILYAVEWMTWEKWMKFEHFRCGETTVGCPVRPGLHSISYFGRLGHKKEVEVRRTNNHKWWVEIKFAANAKYNTHFSRFSFIRSIRRNTSTRRVPQAQTYIGTEMKKITRFCDSTEQRNTENHKNGWGEFRHG